MSVPRPNKDRLTAREVIVDTLAVYREGNRGADAVGHCLYRHPDDPERRCGAGRWFDEETTPESVWGHPGPITNVAMELPKGNLDRILLSAVQEFSLAFWNDIQVLHDLPHYWNANGPTDAGIKYATAVLRDHVGEDEPPITRAEVDAWREEHYGGSEAS